MIPLLHLQSIAEISAAHIAASLIEGTLIALGAAVALRLGRRQSSGARFAIWFSALMTIATLPFLASAVSGLHLFSDSSLPAAFHHPALTLPASWALYLFAAWALIAALYLSRVIVSLHHVRALRKNCVSIDATQLDPVLHQALAAHGASKTRVPHPTRFLLGGNNGPRPVVLCASDRVQVPTAIGFFKPAVVIPTWLLNDLSPDELHQIVLHELAHLRRRDDWTNLAQQIVKALFFFHPAVWWIEKKIALEREMACDDAVLAETSQPRAYAECLAHLAERTLIRRNLIQRGIALAQAAIGRLRHTSLRVAQILDPNRKHAGKHAWKPALSLMAAIAVGSITLASREPQLIAFQDSSTQRVPHPTRFSLSGTDRTSTVIAVDSSVNSSLKPINASFIAPTSPTKKPIQPKLLHKRAVVPAPNPASTNRLALSQPTSPAPAQNTDAQILAFVISSEMLDPTLIHPASLGTGSTVSTETIFVMVEHRSANTAESAIGQPIVQIRFWRLTVFHPVTPTKPIPNEET